MGQKKIEAKNLYEELFAWKEKRNEIIQSGPWSN